MRVRTLLLLDGIIWLIAGVNVCKIGVGTWMTLEGNTLWMVIGCLATFVAFATMFVRMVFKNVRRIEQIEEGHRRVWDMMSVRSYLIMAFMIALGVALRQFSLVPEVFIGSFYTGLGGALAMAGLGYLLYRGEH